MAPRLKGAAEAFKGICEANGISEKTINDDPEKIKSIELFLFNFSKIQALDVFTGLTSLGICQQAIVEMEGLEALVNLEKLWICETNITRIKGIAHLEKLTQLYLYSNRFKVIEGLSTLTNLKTLWLMDNEIEHIHGLETLTQLSHLNLSRNRIREIGSSLDANVNLEELNLAGNYLWSFKDLLNLTRATYLRKLSFNDPDYGDNPVCELCNYQTYVFFHLQQLSHMDTMPIPEEGKHLAEATYMKKKMYYNMRIKTLKRNTTNILRKGKEALLARKSQVTLSLHALIRAAKDIERQMELDSISGAMEEGSRKQLQSKLDLLMHAARNETSKIEVAEGMLDDMREQVCTISNYNTSRLIVELETGGNIRLEDGKPTDVWYSSCVDLVNSRFFQQDFASHGIADLRVVRVTRIHNRFLRNRFEEKLESLVDTSEPGYKRSLEYLFYGDDPRLPGETLRVAEEGFRSASEYERLGMDAAVCLSNSLSLSDLPRVHEFMRSKGVSLGPDGTPAYTPGLEIPSGQLLITKVFLARCLAEKKTKEGGGSGEEGGGAGEEDGWEGTPRALINKSAYPKHDSVFRVKGGDAKQRTWYVFEHGLVLPEYIVEFEYVMKPPVSPDPPLSFMTDLMDRGILQPQNETEANDIGPLARSLVKFLYKCNMQGGGSGKEGQIDETCLKLINTEPVLVQRPTQIAMTPDVFTLEGGSANHASITYLNLHSNSIRKIENLSGLVSLETLILSFNEISKMEGMETFSKLTRLDLSFNVVRRLEGLKNLSTLTRLEMNSNMIHRAEDLSMLRKYCGGLLALNFAGNPVCDMKSYRQYVLRRLLRLTSLDGIEVTEEEQAVAMANTSSIKTQLIRDNAYVQRRSNWSLMPAKFRRQTAVDKAALQPNDEDEEVWWGLVQDLELNSRNLRKLSNLERLVNLKILSICDNEILQIQGLENCVSLEELLMEENRISRIENLDSLCRLKKLDIGKNRISRVEGLENLTNLAQLSLEDNEIESLVGLSALSTLLELYVGNNKIGDMREILHLKALPKLIILDLSGNPLGSNPEYRLYSIFHLKKLKVLDGMGVEGGEQSAANDTYSGRLTADFLVERIGHKFFEHVSELDLSSQKIRDVGGCITGEAFPNIRVLNLDNNIMHDLCGLSGLTSLAVLRLNHNRVEALALEKPKGQTDAPMVGLATLTALEVLQVGFNDIHSLAACRHLNLINLKVLFLQGNDIQKIEGLERMVALRELVLDKNKVRHVDFGAMVSLVNLRELRMEENGLKSLSNFVPLPRLQALHLGTNRVSDMSDLDKLSPLMNLLEFTLQNNPVARKQLYRATAIMKLPSLRVLDGKEISLEERDRVDILFSMESRSQPGYQPIQPQIIQGGSQGGGSKVPIKMSSVTFDQLSGGMQMPYPPGFGAGGLGIGGSAGDRGGQAASFVCIGLSKMSDKAGGEHDDKFHPFHNSTGEFFLPAGKMSGRPRANSAGRSGGSAGGSDSDGPGGHDNWAAGGGGGAIDRRSSADRNGRAGGGAPLHDRKTLSRPRSGDKPRAIMGGAGGAGGIMNSSAAAVASAALEARSMQAGLPPGGGRTRKLGYLLGTGPQNPSTTPRR